MIAVIFMIIFMIVALVAAGFAIALAIEKNNLKSSHGKLQTELVNAQTHAATLFVEKSRLEAQLKNSHTVGGRTLGFSYTPMTAGVGATMIHIQGIINELQKIICPETRVMFEQSKQSILQDFKNNTMDKPISCAKIIEQVKKFNQTLDEQARNNNVGASVINLQKFFLQLWETVVKEVCNDKGEVDVGLLDAYMTAIYKSFCHD